jgi:hypothetical protein
MRASLSFRTAALSPQPRAPLTEIMHANAAWRAVPGPGPEADRARARASRAFRLLALDPSRLGVAGLGSPPTPGVALGAVPVLGARLLGTRPSLPGATQLAVVPFLLLGRPQRKATDRQNRDIAAKYGCYVPGSLILDAWVAVGGGNGTTAGCVAPGGNGFLPNRRACKSGTAVRAATLFGSEPNPATPTPARTMRAGSTRQKPSSSGGCGSARVGDGAPTRRVRLCARVPRNAMLPHSTESALLQSGSPDQ